MEYTPNEKRSSRERQQQVADYVLQRTSATVKELSELFNVTAMTIHRDLDELERQGILRKVRGGATALPSTQFESYVHYRVKASVREKEAIARAALAHVEPGQAVMLESSTTSLMLARHLHQVAPLTVITNSLLVMRELCSHKDIRLIGLGGEYMPKHDACGGVICEQAIAALRANVMFLSPSAIDSGLLFHQEQEIVKIGRAMLASATKRVLLADHTKLGKTALHRLATLSEFDLIITDEGISPLQLEQLTNSSIAVEVAPL